MATQSETLLQLYQCMNGPVKAGPKWVTYSRGQVNAMLDVTKQLMILQGFEFRNEDGSKQEENTNE